MQSSRVQLEAPVADLAALGAEEPADLLGPDGRPATWERGAVLGEQGGRTLVRLPLPGTPDASGRVHERPRGAGTGLVLLSRYHGGGAAGWVRLLRARFTRPRSASLAERDWNLICHLRAHGVGTLDPLAVGASGTGPVARRSFLVTRAPDRLLPLPEWLAGAGAVRRARGARAVGLFLARVFRSGTWLPDLELEHLLLTVEPAGSCGDEGSPVPTAAGATGAGPRRNRLPGVVLAEVAGGRILDAIDAPRRRRLLERLDARARALPPVARPTRLERGRAFVLALR